MDVPPNGPSIPVPVAGRALRYALLLVLHRHRNRDRSVAELVEDLAHLGVQPGHGRPGKVVSDALRWEVARGRADRVGRDRYRLGRLPDVTRWRAGRRIELIRAGLVDDSGYVIAREAGDAATPPFSGPEPMHGGVPFQFSATPPRVGKPPGP